MPKGNIHFIKVIVLYFLTRGLDITNKFQNLMRCKPSMYFLREYLEHLK